MTWTDPENDAVVTMLGAVLEITGTELSPVAAKLVVRQLAAYPALQVLVGLERCARECRFKLTLADIVSRLDDGRPGAEEAWAAFPKDEAEAGVVTDEMSAAWGVAAKLFETDQVAARMAFRETYEREVREARQNARPPRWLLSPGHDRHATESVALEALKVVKLPLSAVEPYVLPENLPSQAPALPAPDVEANKARLAQLVGGIGKRRTDDA